MIGGTCEYCGDRDAVMWSDQGKRQCNECAPPNVRRRPSPTAHARQMAGVRMRAEHAAACKQSGRLLSRGE